ncbi:peptidylprolyl isomerase [Novosphingobium sp.]|uniref:peptidylprolyl isomerase n=1 Tax=Novosphingobium sp. TaxID=1874826 RepID=UPI0031D3AF99
MPFNTMPRRLSLTALAMLGALIPALPGQAAPAAPPPAAKALSAGDIVKAAPAGDWVAIAPQDLLVMALAPDAKGHPRQVVIQLIPAPFSQGWVGNLRKLAAAHWWDGLSVYRVQDNWVAQWGDGDNEDKVKARPLPADLAKVDEREYELHGSVRKVCDQDNCIAGVEPMDWWSQSLRFDPYLFEGGAGQVGFGKGWPMGTNARTSWPIHCYGTVGVARDLSPDTGSGAELYAVIGQPPRMLDRNIAVVGRVIEGIEHLSSLPRAPGNGVYKDTADRTPILSIRLASDLPAEQQPHFEYLSTQSASFARYADLRAHRHDDFIKVAATSADICSIPMPIRRHPAS